MALAHGPAYRTTFCFSAFGMVHTKNMHGDRNKKKRKKKEGRKKKTKKRIEKSEKKESVD